VENMYGNSTECTVCAAGFASTTIGATTAGVCTSCEEDFISGRAPPLLHFSPQPQPFLSLK